MLEDRVMEPIQNCLGKNLALLMYFYVFNAGVLSNHSMEIMLPGIAHWKIKLLQEKNYSAITSRHTTEFSCTSLREMIENTHAYICVLQELKGKRTERFSNAYVKRVLKCTKFLIYNSYLPFVLLLEYSIMSILWKKKN